ncbi:MAG: hypothetical protein ACE37N_14695 [Pseudohongiellaceae bacterium]
MMVSAASLPARDLRDFVAVCACGVGVAGDICPPEKSRFDQTASITRSIRQRGQVEPIFAERIDDVPRILCSVVEEGDDASPYAALRAAAG